MHTTQAKKTKNTVQGTLGPVKTGLILTPRGGRHGDRRLKRQKTRQTRNLLAMTGW